MRNTVSTGLLALAGIWSILAILIDLGRKLPVIIALARFAHGETVVHQTIGPIYSAPWPLFLTSFAPLLLFVGAFFFSHVNPRWLVISSGVLVLLFFMEPPLLWRLIETLSNSH